MYVRVDKMRASTRSDVGDHREEEGASNPRARWSRMAIRHHATKHPDQTSRASHAFNVIRGRRHEPEPLLWTERAVPSPRLDLIY